MVVLLPLRQASRNPYQIFFSYEQLAKPRNQIRLLKRELNARGNEIAFTLKTYELSSSSLPAYNAISYAWGEDGRSQMVEINGKAFRVRHNCYHALWQHSRRYPHDLVWIDSVCINQSDLVEKSQQVRIMGNIYSEAALILACLGKHDESSQFLFDCILRAEQYGCVVRESTEEQSAQMKSWLDGLKYPERCRLTRNFAHFSERAYWTRLWIIPEINTAAGSKCKLLCGEDEIFWMPLNLLTNHLAYYNMSLYTPTMHLVKLLGDFPAVGFEDVLRLYGEAECSDPRDRIFAFLHKIDWLDGLPSILPDYNKTAFALAAESIAHLHHHDFEPLIRALEITNRLHEVRSSIQNTTLAENRQAPRNLHKLVFNRLLPITTDQSDRLTAEMWKDEDMADRYAEVLREHLTMLYRVFIQDCVNKTHKWQQRLPQYVYSGEHLAALACSDARAGDLLMPYYATTADDWFNEELYLVVRPSPDEFSRWDVIGQAISVNGCSISSKSTSLLTHPVELTISAEEIVVLWAQDLGAVNGIDREARLMRLATRVTSSPARAVRRLGPRPPPESETWDSDDLSRARKERKDRLRTAAMEKYGQVYWLRSADSSMENRLLEQDRERRRYRKAMQAWMRSEEGEA